jgi:hypothetical protein
MVSPRNQAEDVGESESFARACVLAYLDRGVQDFNPSNVLVERRGERRVRELPNRRLVNKCIKMRGKVEIRVVLVTRRVVRDRLGVCMAVTLAHR